MFVLKPNGVRCLMAFQSGVALTPERVLGILSVIYYNLNNIPESTDQIVSFADQYDDDQMQGFREYMQDITVVTSLTRT